MHLHDDTSRPFFETLPIELIIKIFEQMPVLDRVQLALCNKGFAKIATTNQLLHPANEYPSNLCENAEWFSGLEDVHLNGTPECCYREEPGWQRHAKTEIERQGGLLTHGIMLAIESWWISPYMWSMNADSWMYEGIEEPDADGGSGEQDTNGEIEDGNEDATRLAILGQETETENEGSNN